MDASLSRRDVLKTMTLTGLAGLSASAAGVRQNHGPDGWVRGKMTGAEAVVEALKVEGTQCVFGIPGAQENELWDVMKARHLPFLLVTHEFSAACMADGYARSTGQPGVLCIVPGPGVTNSLSGLGEALLDSIPLVAIVGDVARGDKYRAFQVHELPNVALLKPVTKAVFEVTHPSQIADAVRKAFQTARCGEPGPTAVVVPYNYLIDVCEFASAPLDHSPVPLDEDAFAKALGILSGKGRIGIYAGLGCMDCGPMVLKLAELMQAPIATSVSGKGVVDECHPLAVGWGYGPQGTKTAEEVFKSVDVVLAIGVRYSEVSTGFYAIPKKPLVIHVDVNEKNLGRNLPKAVCVHAEASLFLSRLLEHAGAIGRCHDAPLLNLIARLKAEDAKRHQKLYARCGADPMAFLLALRRCTRSDALVFVDVTLTEHLAAEAFAVSCPRTYFNPTDNQAMGWSIPAALGAQQVHPGRQVVTITGDGCLLMSAIEMSTAARACLPVKFFILDDQAYHYMQVLQKAAYRRTTATILAKIDYPALAKALGLAYVEIGATAELDNGLKTALSQEGPVLTRIITDYGKRPVRWIEAAKDRFRDELSGAQKARFLARISSRALQPNPFSD